MEIRYDVLIESVKELSLHDKKDLRRLLDKYIIGEGGKRFIRIT